MSKSTSQQSLAFAGIDCNAERLRELEGNRVMVLIPRTEVRRITLCYGSPAQHPITQIFAGFIMLAMGALPTL
jgi:hypothetical protein